MGNLIQGAKVGSIVRTPSHSQYFYVHNIVGDTMIMSGINVDGDVYPKDPRYLVSEVTPREEEHIFFDLLNKYNFKLNLNIGIEYVDRI